MLYIKVLLICGSACGNICSTAYTALFMYVPVIGIDLMQLHCKLLYYDSLFDLCTISCSDMQATHWSLMTDCMLSTVLCICMDLNFITRKRMPTWHHEKYAGLDKYYPLCRETLEPNMKSAMLVEDIIFTILLDGWNELQINFWC